MIQAQPAGLCSALRKRGHCATLIDPQAISFAMDDENDWLDGLDLIVARGRSLLLLGMLAWAEARGMRTINRRRAIAAVHNKAEMSIALVTAGLPTPRTFFGSLQHLASRVPRASYPLILKPIFGDNCQGLRLVHNRDELTALESPELVVLAQYFVSSDGYDLKLYGIGDEIWAVRKPSPFKGPGRMPSISRSNDHDARAELLPLTPALRELGRRCRELFGLALYGVDCIQTSAGPVVIEVNDFPNYTGVPDADQRLTDYVQQWALNIPPSGRFCARMPALPQASDGCLVQQGYSNHEASGRVPEQL
ncbi:MAG: ATP-grasp domain-containing protein [bacterium]